MRGSHRPPPGHSVSDNPPVHSPAYRQRLVPHTLPQPAAQSLHSSPWCTRVTEGSWSSKGPVAVVHVSQDRAQHGQGSSALPRSVSSLRKTTAPSYLRPLQNPTRTHYPGACLPGRQTGDDSTEAEPSGRQGGIHSDPGLGGPLLPSSAASPEQGAAFCCFHKHLPAASQDAPTFLTLVYPDAPGSEGLHPAFHGLAHDCDTTGSPLPGRLSPIPSPGWFLARSPSC